MSGPTADWGRAAYRGAELAVQHLEARGIRLRLLPAEDNHGDASAAAEAVRRLVSLRGAQAIVGPITSTNARSAAKVADELKIPIVSPAATDAALTRDSKYAFRACYVDDFQGRILATFARNDLKSTRAAILVDSSDAYSFGLANAFRASFTSAGGDTSDVTISLTEREFGPQIQNLKQARKVDLVFMPANYPAVAAFLREARQARLTQTFLTADGAHSPELFTLAGDAADGIYLTSHFAPDSNAPDVRRFVDAFTRNYSEPPNVAAALAYDAVLMIGQGFTEVKAGETLRDSMTHIRGLSGVTGTISLDANRNPVKSVIVLRTANQRFNYVRTVAP
jgi:branched-chain amino acid transport system substrate-binding protein